MKHKVMIVDDQYVSRQMFELYLKNSDRYEVVFSIDPPCLPTHMS